MPDTVPYRRTLGERVGLSVTVPAICTLVSAMAVSHYMRQIEAVEERYGVSKDSVASVIAKEPDGPFVRAVRDPYGKAHTASLFLWISFTLTVGGLIYRSIKDMKE